MHRIRSSVIVFLFFLCVVLLFHLDLMLSFLHSGGISSIAGLIMTSRNSARCAKKSLFTVIGLAPYLLPLFW